MNEFLTTKSHLANKVLDWLNDIQTLEKQTDDLYKINLYLLRRYKDDLMKEFNISIPDKLFEDPMLKMLETVFGEKVDTNNETLILSLIVNKIKEKMQKEMPEPWYCYGFGQKVDIDN